MEPSKAFSLNLTDVKRVGINGLLVGLAATLTYMGGNLAEIDFGATSMVVCQSLASYLMQRSNGLRTTIFRKLQTTQLNFILTARKLRWLNYLILD